MTTLKVSLVFLVMAAVSSLHAGAPVKPAIASHSLEATDYTITYMGSTFWSGFVDQYVEGPYAYCATETGLLILDVSDPTNVSVVSQLATEEADAITKSDSLLILSTEYAVRFIDVSDPAVPVMLGTYVGHVDYMFVVDTLLVVSTDDAEGFDVLNISDPTNPTMIGSFTTGVVARDFIGIYASDSLVYVLHGSYSWDLFGCLEVVGLSDPTSPDLISTYCDNGMFASGLAVADSFAYLLRVDSSDWPIIHGFQVWNVADPTQAVLVGEYADSTHPVYYHFSDFEVHDSIVYLSYYGGDLMFGGYLDLINVGDPANPFGCGAARVTDPIGQVFIHDGMAYLVNGAIGWSGHRDLLLVDVSDPNAPVLEATYRPGPVTGAVIVDSLAYVFHGSDMSILDFSDPGNMSVLGEYGPIDQQDFVIRDSLMFVVDGLPGLKILDIGDPTAPTLVCDRDLSGESRGIDVHGDIAAVSNFTLGLQILDVSDPASPDSIGGHVGLGRGYDVIIRDTLVYLADHTIVKVFDISDPSLPDSIAAYGTSTVAQELALDGNMLHVTNATAGYTILDVSDPTNLTLVSNYDPGVVEGVTIQGNLSYLRLHPGGIVMVDISDPYSPVPIDTYMSSVKFAHVAATDQRLLLSTDQWLAAYSIDYTEPCCEGIRGNVDGDSGELIDISDLVYLVDYMFVGGPAPTCFKEADVDAGGSLDIGDLVYLVDYMFSGGPEPPTCD